MSRARSSWTWPTPSPTPSPAASPHGRGGHGRRQKLRLSRPGHSRRRADKECRVVVSTHTISLQEQLIRKDIPFLQTVMPKPFNAVLVKGAVNYLSLRRLRGGPAAQRRLLAEASAAEQLSQIGRWSRQTQRRQPQRSALSAAARRLGPGRERQRQLPGPQLPRLCRLLLLQGPQAASSAPSC